MSPFLVGAALYGIAFVALVGTIVSAIRRFGWHEAAEMAAFTVLVIGLFIALTAVGQ